MKVLFVLLVLCSDCYAFDDWSKTDYALQASYTVLHVMDWNQTRNISDRNGERVIVSTSKGTTVGYRQESESNIFLGKNPSQALINGYFAGTLILHTAIAYILPSRYRTAWQCVTIGFEGSTVVRNARLGISMSF